MKKTIIPKTETKEPTELYNFKLNKYQDNQGSSRHTSYTQKMHRKKS